jgi:hypothetical protein
MVDRRKVLKLGAAGIAGVLVDVPIGAWGVMSGAFPNALYRAVFDERFEEGRAFANELRHRGVVTSGIRGDVATLWYEDLQGSLTECRAPIAGLTDRVALFCLEELARDVGMRVCFRVDHLIDVLGHVHHDAAGPAAMVDATRQLASGSGFGRAMAVLASQFDGGRSRDLTAHKRTGPFSPENETALVSWVIA